MFNILDRYFVFAAAANCYFLSGHQVALLIIQLQKVNRLVLHGN